MRRGLLTLAVFAVAACAAGQRPSADWRTIDTVHFRIHFAAGFDPWARHLAGSIEGIYAGVVDLVGYAPPRFIEVIVCDPAADSNGLAIPYLDRPEIVLWTSPPGAEAGLGEYSDWAALLTTHELAHIAHLTRPRNRALGILARISPAPFGPIAVTSPRWVTEGYATLVEGALTGSGRPSSSFRAMVLRQFGIEGKLPSYGALSGSKGWLGGSMAYLVGSAYLEWLAEREGRDSLRNLWKRMASSRGGGFASSFRGVFGEDARDLYGRFTAEVTARSIAEEKRLRADGLVEGEPWQRLSGGTSAPQVSPNGLRFLVRRDPAPGESFLAVWELADTESELRAREERRQRDARLASDPNEVADRPELPRPRKPRWTLPRADGFAAADPRWMPDGASVLFARRSPDGEGVLHWDLHQWQVERGAVRRITRAADVFDADPAPDGRFAVAVQGRHGTSALVRVDLETGAVREIVTEATEDEAWPVWSHPRLSPDGKRIAALMHRSGRWHLVALPAEGGEVRDLGLRNAPVAPPAWSPDAGRIFVTAEEAGIWNLFALDPLTGGAEQRTRVTGGAFSPAPTPDGGSVFFLNLTAKGVDVRRLSLSGPPPAPASSPRSADGSPAVAPPGIEAARAATVTPVAAARPYGPWETQTARPLVNLSIGPDGTSVQLGLDGSDVLGRLHWLAAASVGDAAGPRGGTLAAAYRGLPVDLTAQVFSAIEKPGRQSLVHRPELDQDRRGGYLGLSWSRELPSGRVRVDAGGGATRVEAISDRRRFVRALGGVEGELALRRTRDRSGVGLTLEGEGTFGSTDGGSWRQVAGGIRAQGITAWATFTAAARFGETGGAPTRFDLFAIGGGPATILPPGLDRNRIESPALPADVQRGERFAAYRAELATASFPLVLYGEWLRAWNKGSEPPGFVRVAGAELRLERFVPAEFDRSLTFRLGIARILSDAPRFRSTRAYAGLIYRP